MSEQPTITIEVNGQTLQAKPGQMLIEVTDAAGITVPRFCYHKKLSISANCRMCLVEVENAPKPLPACATPVTDGMKVYTNSPLARDAQKGTMEFLLINHPLDCPICDQGGECELQDLSVGYGAAVSRFVEGKRAVVSDDIGPLVATDMTRCIHCTRCVRFGEEIAGVRELGATGRGEHTKIGSYVKHSMSSELAGNVIDLCPVGALTSKPFRFRARPWEMTRHPSIAAHDGVGSNIDLHVRNHRVMRVVPRENEAINETWISDRDRFSYQGLYAEDRLHAPRVRMDGRLQETDWQQALLKAGEIINKHAGGRMGALVSPNATLEEMHLLQKLLRSLGCQNLDHRLRMTDERLTAIEPGLAWLGQSFARMENNQATLLIGSWLRKDQPLLNHRLRKSVLAGGQVMVVNPIAYDFNYELAHECVVPPQQWVNELVAIAQAAGADTLGLGAQVQPVHQAIAQTLEKASQGLVLLGAQVQSHPDAALLRQLARHIAEHTGVDLGFAPEGANVVGAYLAGLLPKDDGESVPEMLKKGLDACILFNVEPEFDTGNPQQMKAMLESAQCIVLATHSSPWIERHADVILPIAAFAETSGTYINLQGDVQTFEGALAPVGKARPGWKVLRVLGTQLELEGFAFDSSAAIKEEALQNGLRLDNSWEGHLDSPGLRSGQSDWQRIGGLNIHATDMLVRRARALQATPDAWVCGVRMNRASAEILQVAEGDEVRVRQGTCEAVFPVFMDERVPLQCLWLPLGVVGSERLAEGFGAITVEKA